MKKIAVVAIAILVLGVPAYFGFRYGQNYRLQKVVQKADDEAKRGFWALAFENLDGYRRQLVKNEKDCNALLNVYDKAKKADRLEWAAQACIEAGIETYQNYLYLAASQEMFGRDGEALSLLKQLTAKFDKEPEAYRHISAILLRNKDEAGAAEALYQSAIRNSDPQQKLDVMQMLLRQKRNDEALKLAQDLKEVKTENPEVRLTVARAFFAGHDKLSGQAQIDEAKSTMTKLAPERVKKIEADFSDVLKVNHK